MLDDNAEPPAFQPFDESNTVLGSHCMTKSGFQFLSQSENIGRAFH